MVRLVAVTVEEHDFARRNKRLMGHLVRCRGAVRHKEHMIGTKGARSHRLRLLDVARGLQKAVKTARRRARFRKKDVKAIEFAHGPDPVGSENGLAPRDGQRMECADWPHRVFLEIVEKRRAIRVCNAFLHAQVQFQHLRDRIEDAADICGARTSGHAFNVAVGQKMDIDLGAEPLQPVGKCQRHVIAVHMGRVKACSGQDFAQHRRIMARGMVEPFIDRDGVD